MPAMQRSASRGVTRASSRIDSSRSRAITGIITLSSKLPLAPATATVASLPITWAQTIRVASGQHRVDLARHDARARLQVGQVDLGQAGGRPRGHPAQVVADLGQADRDGAQLAGQLDQRVLPALGLEVVAGLAERQPGLRSEVGDHLLGEAVGGVDAGADRRAAQRELGHPRQGRLQALDRRAARSRRTPRTPGRASPASRPSGGCGPTSRRRRTPRPWPPGRPRGAAATAPGRWWWPRRRPRGCWWGRCRCSTGWR